MTEREEFKKAEADREPTPEEEAAAEKAAQDVDVDAVATEFEHMTDLGAHVQGEGRVEGAVPPPSTPAP
jgi:hypothetical protein